MPGSVARGSFPAGERMQANRARDFASVGGFELRNFATFGQHP